MKIELKHNLWSGQQTLRINLPDQWNVRVIRMRGDENSVLQASQYRQAFVSLKNMIKGKKNIAVLFDDLSRPTKVYQFIPFLLEFFEKCRIKDEQVRFICALGTHAPHDNTAFRKKLGQNVLDRFPVYNHLVYENCDYLGETRLGTPILVNREYLSCDLKIGIGTLLPHSFCGHGGGYKIVMPGVAHMDSIANHHGSLLSQHKEFCAFGRSQWNPLLEDVKEFGRAAGLDIVINLLINSQAEGVDLYAGPPDGVYGAFAEKGMAHYGAEVPGKADIVIANMYCKGNEATVGLSLAEQLLKEEGGDVVLLSGVPEGQVVHYLFGRFGENAWGRVGFGERKNSKKIRKLFIFSRYKDLAGSFWFGPRQEITWYNDFSEIISALTERFTTTIPVVYVIPDATIQTVDFIR